MSERVVVNIWLGFDKNIKKTIVGKTFGFNKRYGEWCYESKLSLPFAIPFIGAASCTSPTIG